MPEAYQSVFRRYEKKYLLDQKQYRQVQEVLGEKMEPDQYGSYTICNTYYDTDDYRLIRGSLEKPVYKEKLRVRSYGVPKKQDPVFVEIKKKFQGIVYKRRISLPVDIAEQCLTAEDDHSFAHAVGTSSADHQIACELDWFCRYYRPHPAVWLAYDRKAYFSRQTAGLRITFDTGIRFRQTQLDLTAGDYGTLLQKENQVLMEIKIPDSMPLWLAETLSWAKIYPVSYSKYGNCYREYLSEQFLRNLRGENNQGQELKNGRSEKIWIPEDLWDSKTGTEYQAGGMDYA